MSRVSSSWAKQRLKELLLGVEFDASEGVVEVVAVEKIEGDAEVRQRGAYPLGPTHRGRDHRGRVRNDE